MSAMLTALVWIHFMQWLSVPTDGHTSDDVTNVPPRDYNGAQHQLYEHLFRTYHSQLRPVQQQNATISVTVQFYFKQVLKVHESDQILTIYLWLEQYWHDDYLKWDPSDFDGLETLHVPADKVWRPDLMVYNKCVIHCDRNPLLYIHSKSFSANMNVKENELLTNVMLRHNGSVSLFRAVITDITCGLDMTYFPFDQQFCHIMLASWTLASDQMEIHHIGLDVSMKHYTSNLEWSLTSFRARKNYRWYDCCPEPYPDLSYYFVIRRNPVYYMLTLIVPSAFITIVTVVGFFTPHSSSGENTEKVSLGVTALLSLAIILMMVSDKMPATSKVVPLLGQYYVGLILIMFLATCATTVTLTVQMKGNGGRRLPIRFRNLLSHRFARLLTASDYHHFDRFISQTSASGNAHDTNTTMLINKNRRTNQSTPPQANNRDSIISDKSVCCCCLINKAINELDGSGLMKFQDVTISLLADRHCHTSASVDSFGACATPPPIGTTLVQQLMQQPLRAIAASVDAIGKHLDEDKHLVRIRSEWQRMARFLERIFMFIFIVITTSFTTWMVYDGQEPIEITQHKMDLLSNPNWTLSWAGD